MPVMAALAIAKERSAPKSVLIQSLVGVAEQRGQQVETERQSLRLVSGTKCESKAGTAALIRITLVQAHPFRLRIDFGARRSGDVPLLEMHITGSILTEADL
jgi:hypothetical protein